jgi:hypothetical protein
MTPGSAGVLPPENQNPAPDFKPTETRQETPSEAAAANVAASLSIKNASKSLERQTQPKPPIWPLVLFAIGAGLAIMIVIRFTLDRMVPSPVR